MHRRADAPTPTTSGTESPSAARVRRFQARVLEWGVDHRRDLPWRHTRDPWRVLVSEVMLQQTQVDRVIAYYSAFLRAYPRAVDCARARPGDVVRLWSGLGYNRRALNLHRTATAIADEYGGAVPADESSLRALPGIGAYTARAVLSFAFEADVATVDTNVVRVLSRGVAGAGLTLAQAQSLADRLLPAGHSWEFNQSMFDLGATVCTAPLRCAASVPCATSADGSVAACPHPTRGGPAPRYAPSRRSPDRIARVAGASSRPCARAPCPRRCWRPPAGGLTTPLGRSGSRCRSWPRGSPSGPTVTRPCSGCDSERGAIPRAVRN